MSDLAALQNIYCSGADCEDSCQFMTIMTLTPLQSCFLLLVRRGA